MKVMMDKKVYNDILKKAYAYEFIFFKSETKQANSLESLIIMIGDILDDFGYSKNQMDSIQIKREIIKRARPLEWSYKIFG